MMNRLIVSSTSRLYTTASSSSKQILTRLGLPNILDDTRNTARSYSSSTVVSGNDNTWHGTTILCVRKNNEVCMIGDGMVSMGSVTIKPNAKKIRRIYPKTVGGRRASTATTDEKKDSDGDDGGEDSNDGSTIVGFAGSTADAFTLLERLEGKLDEYPGQLTRSCVELAKGWRTDKYLRRLEASLIVADENVSLEITGNGDVLEPHDGVLAVGSGGFYAVAAARALTYNVPEMSAEEVARKAMDIASDMCIYTNKEYIVETMKTKEKQGDEKKEE